MRGIKGRGDSVMHYVLLQCMLCCCRSQSLYLCRRCCCWLSLVVPSLLPAPAVVRCGAAGLVHIAFLLLHTRAAQSTCTGAL